MAKNFRCSQCSKAFRTEAARDQHAKDTEHKTSFKCKCCDFCSTKADDVRQHYVDTHGFTYHGMHVSHIQSMACAWGKNIAASVYLGID